MPNATKAWKDWKPGGRGRPPKGREAEHARAVIAKLNARVAEIRKKSKAGAGRAKP